MTSHRQEAHTSTYRLTPGIPGDTQCCLPSLGLTAEFADAAIRLQQVAREAATAVGPWSIEADLAAGFLALLCALIHIHTGHAVLSQLIAWSAPATLWGQQVCGAPYCSLCSPRKHSGARLPGHGSQHSQVPGVMGSRAVSRVSGRAGSSFLPHLSHPCSPADRCTPVMHSGRSPARRGTHGSGREWVGLQGRSCPQPQPLTPCAQQELLGGAQNTQQ